MDTLTLVPLRVLLLEDHLSDAELLLDELVQSGFAPEWQRVDSEAEYLARLDPSVDIILADYHMPQFNAIRALELLRQQRFDIPFIVVSGSIGEELAVHAIKQGATDYLLKDRLARLGEAVKQALRQKEAQTALRQSEMRFAKIFRVSPVGVVIAELANGFILDVNESFLHILEQGREKVIGHRMSDLGIGAFFSGQPTLPDSSSRSWTITNAEAQLHTASGEIRHALISAEVIDLGNKTCVLGFVYDITDRKRAEAEMMQNELLRIELDKEKELLNLKERFMSMVTHEFRTPLAVILTASSVVKQYSDRLTNEKRLKHLQNIQDQVKYMDRLMSDVLNFSKAQSGKLAFTPKLIDVGAFCAEIVEQLQLIDGEAHQFVLTNRTQAGRVYLDERLLRHILVNLLSNAIKYSPQGGEIGLELVREEMALVFRISDQGIGIPGDDLKHLFEPFHRAVNVGEIEGTGLGLAIVKSNVEAHGGTIVCESQTSKGTTFIVRIPVDTQS